MLKITGAELRARATTIHIAAGETRGKGKDDLVIPSEEVERLLERVARQLEAHERALAAHEAGAATMATEMATLQEAHDELATLNTGQEETIRHLNERIGELEEVEIYDGQLL